MDGQQLEACRLMIRWADEHRDELLTSRESAKIEEMEERCEEALRKSFGQNPLTREVIHRYFENIGA